MQYYKYYSYKSEDKLCLDFLKDGKFKFEQVQKYNDVYEGNWAGLIREYSLDELEEERKKIRKYSSLDTVIDQEMVAYENMLLPGDSINPIDVPVAFDPDEVRYDWDLNRRRIREEIDSFGVLCLSDSNTNQLMWCHYGNSEKGICIGFDGNHEFFNGRTYKVIYSKNRPNVNKLIYNDQLSDDEIRIFVKKAMLSKNKIWKYENEYRVLMTLDEMEFEKNKKVYLRAIPLDAISSITFGSRADYSAKRETFIAVHSRRELQHIKMWEILRNTNGYGYRLFELRN